MAYQGLQSTIINLTLFFGIFALFEFQPTAKIPNLLLLSAIFTLSVYSLWGALDTFLGFEFNYILIGNISKKYLIQISIENVLKINIVTKNNRDYDRVQLF